MISDADLARMEAAAQLERESGYNGLWSEVVALIAEVRRLRDGRINPPCPLGIQQDRDTTS